MEFIPNSGRQKWLSKEELDGHTFRKYS
jgi:hypothetical protein